MVEFNNLVTQQTVKDALKGKIKALCYIRSSVPDDIANDLKLDDNHEVLGEMQLIIKTKMRERIAFTQWMTDLANGKIKKDQYLEIHNIKFDDVKLDVEVKKKPMRIDLEDILGKFRSSVDITDDVKLKDGHPTTESLLACAKKMLPALRSAKWK